MVFTPNGDDELPRRPSPNQRPLGVLSWSASNRSMSRMFFFTLRTLTEALSNDSRSPVELLMQIHLWGLSLGKARNGLKLLILSVSSNDLTVFFFLLCQVCCGNKVFSNAKFCCGRVGYNPMTQTCCGGQVLTPHGGPFHSLSGCCGKSLYKPSIQDCCHGGYIRPKGCCYNTHHQGERPQHGFWLCRELQ